MDKICKFFECLVPVTACNLKCEYCYIIQREQRENKMPHFKYSPQIIGKALTRERLGGTCFFSICGMGETLIPNEVIEIASEILRQGHYVNITTNGTMSDRFDEILCLPKEDLERMHFSFSLHYLELKRLNLLDIFADNVNKVKAAGCSIMVQINLCDQYIKVEDEIKSFCINKFGALPQVALTRKEKDLNSNIQVYSNLSYEDYINKGKVYESPLFECTTMSFHKKSNRFCYAGKWSFTLNLADGILRSCYTSDSIQNIFEDIEKTINLQVVGHNCKSPYCMNAHHFMALGVRPDEKMLTYAEMRNRKESNWYTEKMKNFLNQKLYENNRYEEEDIFSENHIHKIKFVNNIWKDKVWLLDDSYLVKKVDIWVMVIGEKVNARLGIGSDMEDFNYNEYNIILKSGMNHLIIDVDKADIKRGNVNFSQIRKVILGGMSMNSQAIFAIKIGRYLIDNNK